MSNQTFVFAQSWATVRWSPVPSPILIWCHQPKNSDMTQDIPKCNVNLHQICLLSFRSKEQKRVFEVSSVPSSPLEGITAEPPWSSLNFQEENLLTSAQASVSQMLISSGSTKTSSSPLSNSKSEQIKSPELHHEMLDSSNPSAIV